MQVYLVNLGRIHRGCPLNMVQKRCITSISFTHLSVYILNEKVCAVCRILDLQMGNRPYL